MTSTAQPTARCLRPGCGRKLTSAKSVATGYGPVCRARIRAAAMAEAVKGFAAAQIDKARELIADGGIIPTNRPGVFRAVSSKGDETYLTHRDVCNCPAGLRARPCYHLAAARILTAAA
jgi:hypothetical protein